MRFGAASMIRRTTFCESPARGGSTTSTSGRPACCDELAQRQPHIAGKEAGVVDLVAARVARSRRRSPPRRSPAPTARPRAAPSAARSCRSRSRGRRRARSRAARRTRSPARTAARPSPCWSGRTPRREIRTARPPSSSCEPIGAGEQLGRAAGGRLGDAVESASTAGRLRSRQRRASDRGRAGRGWSRAAPAARRCGGPRGRRGCAGSRRRCGGRTARGPASRHQATHLLAGPVARLGGEQAVARLDDLLPAAGRVEAADRGVPSASVPNEYSSLLR